MKLVDFLQAAGVAPKKEAAQIIKEGSVVVDGEVVLDPGREIDPIRSKVYFANLRVKLPRKPLIYAAYKPKDYNSSFMAKDGIYPFFKKLAFRVYPDALLPKFASGLILLHNQPWLSKALAKVDLPSLYRIKLRGNWGAKHREKLLSGMRIEGKFLKLERILSEKKRGDRVSLLLEFTHRFPSLLKLMFLRRELSVMAMTRLSLGPIKLGKLKGGEARLLSQEEMEALKEELQKRGWKTEENAL